MSRPPSRSTTPSSDQQRRETEAARQSRLPAADEQPFAQRTQRPYGPKLSQSPTSAPPKPQTSASRLTSGMTPPPPPPPPQQPEPPPPKERKPPPPPKPPKPPPPPKEPKPPPPPKEPKPPPPPKEPKPPPPPKEPKPPPPPKEPKPPPPPKEPKPPPPPKPPKPPPPPKEPKPPPKPKEPKPPKNKKPKPPPEPGEPKPHEDGTARPHGHRIHPAQSKSPAKYDIYFMSIVWTTEMVYHLSDISLDRYTKDFENTNSTPQARELDVEGTINSMTFPIITVIAMVGAGITLTLFLKMKVKGTYILWITCSLLALYYLTGPVAALLISTKTAAISFVLRILKIVWNVFSPIRFWYIFHQFFPIDIRWSHLIVSGNVLAIGFIEYVVVIYVKEAPDTPPFTERFYYILFVISAVAGLGWLVALIFLSKYRNRVNGDLSSVKEVYENTEVIEKFKRRQTVISIIMFIALILPAVIIPVMKEFADLGYDRLTDNAVSIDSVWFHRRPDLIISLLVVVVVEILLQLLRNIRNELNDLVLVVAAQAINIFVIVFFISILNRSVITRKLMGETSAANLIVHTTVKDYINIDVGRYIKQESVNNLKQLYVDDVPKDGMVHIRIRFDGREEIIYEADIHLEIHRCKRVEKLMYVNFYIFRRFQGGFQFYRTPLAFANTSSVHPVFFNAIPRCNNYDHAVAERIGFAPEVTTGVLSESGKCLPMTWWFFPYPLPGYPDDKAFYPVVKPPEHDSYYVPEFENDCHPKFAKFNFTCRPIMMNFRYLSNYYKQVYPAEWKTIIRPVTAFFAPERPDRLIVMGVKFSPFSGPGTYDLPRGSFITISLPDALPETELLRVMVLNGIFLGIAWVGYIHFIWIQCPIRLRFFIIFIFFTLMYISSILSKLMLKEFTERTTNLVLAMAVICTSWQVLTSMLFVARWSIHHRKDPPQERWPRF